MPNPHFLLLTPPQQWHKGVGVSTEPLALCHHIWFANAVGSFKSNPSIDIFPFHSHTSQGNTTFLIKQVKN